MSQQDVQIVQGLLGPFQDDMTALYRDDAIAAGLMEATADAIAPDFQCEFIRADVGRSTHRAAEGLRAGMLDWLEPWDSYHAGVEEVIDAGQGQVLVLTRDRARPKGSEAEVSFLGASVWTVRDGKVARIEFYWDRAEGLAAAGQAA
ncbi:MAG: nuclear transport factor 2 family protein [Solirubrobacteraceae bacterium]